MASALGKSPEAIERVEENGNKVVENRVKGQIMPYRVTEAFYLAFGKGKLYPILLLGDFIQPQRRDKTDRVFYYENERASLMSRIEAARRNLGINLNGFMNRWKVEEHAQI